MNKKNITVILLALILGTLGIIYVSGQITAYLAIQTSGITTSNALVSNPPSIIWGTVHSNSETHQSARITNNGIVALKLSMSPSGLPTWLTIVWNATDYILNPSESIGAKWTLTIGDVAPGTLFAFGIIISGVEP